MSALIAKKAAQQAEHVLKRLAQITGTPVRQFDAAQKASFLEMTDDDSFEREYHAVRNSLNDLKTQHSPALSHVPASFIANPKINFAGFREMAHKLQSRTSLANFWLEEINRAEATHEKETNVSFDKEAEDALLNVLVPLERQFADVNEGLVIMAETAQTRIDEIKAALAKTDAELQQLDTVTIYDVEDEHPDWKAEADHNILHHEWNTIENEHDKDAHH